MNTNDYSSQRSGIVPNSKREKRVMLVNLCLCVFFLLSVLLSFLTLSRLRAQIPGQDAAERWKPEDSTFAFTQAAVYWADSAAVNIETVYSSRINFIKQFETNALTPATEGGSLYYDAYSSETSCSVSSDRASVSATAVAAGGHFFYFHPFTLVSGSYFSEDSTDINTLLLDETAAWRLFGSSDVVGMEVTLSGQIFTVCGVIADPVGSVEKSAYGALPRIFVNYEGYRIAAGYDKITSYEIVLPNPIKNFGVGLVKTVFGISDTDTSVTAVECTGRCSVLKLFSGISGFFLRAMRRDTVIFPYWENIARVAESKGVCIVFFGTVFLVLALLFLIIFLSLFFYLHPIRLRAAADFLETRVEKMRARRKEKRAAAPLLTKEEKKARKAAEKAEKSKKAKEKKTLPKKDMPKKIKPF